MTTDVDADDDAERLATVLGNILVLSANESLVAAQMEAFSFFSPMPASLPLSDDSPLESKLGQLSEAFGGPPKLVLIKDGEAPPRYDTYAYAAITESIKAFMRARASVCRTHIFMIGSAMLREHPESMHLPEDPNVCRIIVTETESRFWEHAGTSYIRLASFWDRVRQILDFVFFNIRQYERDGFSAVIDRIYRNHAVLGTTLHSSLSWARLRKFQTNEQPVGLKWLLRRRNLLVHSLHLDTVPEAQANSPIFMSAYNHLDEAMRNKLRQGSPEEELHALHLHLSAAASLFPDAIELRYWALPMLNGSKLAVNRASADGVSG